MTYHFNTDDEREWLKAEGAEMNSIVEQLHKSGDEVFSTRKKSQLADMIESQERRIKELELEVQVTEIARKQYQAETEAIRQRIKELEAENIEHRRLHRQSEETVRALHREATEYKAELAALRKRIEDAPVVAHITEDGKVFSNGFVRDTDKPLISKEDLQK